MQQVLPGSENMMWSYQLQPDRTTSFHWLGPIQAKTVQATDAGSQRSLWACLWLKEPDFLKLGILSGAFVDISDVPDSAGRCKDATGCAADAAQLGTKGLSSAASAAISSWLLTLRSASKSSFLACLYINRINKTRLHDSAQDSWQQCQSL